MIELKYQIGNIEWIKNQIREFEEECESQSDRERCLFIDGKLTILKLWLGEKEGAFDYSKSTKNEKKMCRICKERETRSNDSNICGECGETYLESTKNEVNTPQGEALRDVPPLGQVSSKTSQNVHTQNKELLDKDYAKEDRGEQ